MKWTLAAVLLGLGASAMPADAAAPLYDSVGLNIGLSCQWQRQCMAKQDRAMRRALYYVQTRRPPVWRVQLCNRNARRARNRVDWIGFDNCVRNTSLRPIRARWRGH